MAKQLTTDTSIRKWKISKENETYSCGNRLGLYVRGYLSQKKAFYWRHTTWIKLGDYPELTLGVAREMVVTCKRLQKNGKSLENIQLAVSISNTAEDLEQNIANQHLNDRTTNITYDEVFQEWYERNASKLWQDGPSRRRPAAMHEHWVPENFKIMPIADIKRQDIFPFMQKMFDQVYDSARKQLAYLVRIFEYANNSGYVESNPVPPRSAFEAVTPAPKPHGYLEYERLPELWHWIDTKNFNPHIALAMKTVMLTGHRISVVVQAKWEHIDVSSGIWTIPARSNLDKVTTGTMKSGRQFNVQLPDEYINSLLEQKSDQIFVFPSPTTASYVTPNATLKSFKAFDKAITNHGFRNTIKTWGRNEGFNDFVMDAYLDHGLKGLDKSYRREDLSHHCAQVTEKLYSFLEGEK